MCGFVGRVTDSPHVKALLSILGLEDFNLTPGQFRPRGEIADVIISQNGLVQTINATWWYALVKQDQRWVPNAKVTSFNARDLTKPLWSEAIASRRAIVFADTIGERHQQTNTQYLMQGIKGLILGALYKAYPTNEGVQYGVSIITRNPHPRLNAFHEKACPLFLPPDKEFLTNWLDPQVSTNNAIKTLLAEPKLFYSMEVTPVKTYVRGEPLGPTILLEKDKS